MITAGNRVAGAFNKYARCLQSGQSHAGRRRCKEEGRHRHAAPRPAAEALAARENRLHSTHEQVEKSQATVGRSALGATTSREAIEARPPALVGQLQCAAARATPVKSPTGAGAPSELLVVQWSAWPHRPVAVTEAAPLPWAAITKKPQRVTSVSGSTIGTTSQEAIQAHLTVLVW